MTSFAGVVISLALVAMPIGVVFLCKRVIGVACWFAHLLIFFYLRVFVEWLDYIVPGIIRSMYGLSSWDYSKWESWYLFSTGNGKGEGQQKYPSFPVLSIYCLVRVIFLYLLPDSSRRVTLYLSYNIVFI